MKNLILILIAAASSFAFADANRNVAFEWLKTLAPDIKPIDAANHGLGAVTFNGDSCNLSFTFNDTKAAKYITVGDNNFKGSKEQKERDGYVGISVESEEKYDLIKYEVGNRSYSFSSNRTWSNDSKWNKIVIDVDGSGKPVHVTGTSDLQTLSCDVK